MLIAPEETRLREVERRYTRLDADLDALTTAIRRLQQQMRDAGDMNGQPAGGLLVKVTDCGTGLPIPAALVDVKLSGIIVAEALTRSDGTYLFLLAPDTYDLVVNAAGYATGTVSAVVVAGGALVDESLCLNPSGVSATCCSGVSVPTSLTLVDPDGNTAPATWDGSTWWVGCTTVATPAGFCSSVTTAVRFRLNASCSADVFYQGNPTTLCPVGNSCATASFPTAIAGGLAPAPVRTALTCSPFSITFSFSADGKVYASGRGTLHFTFHA